MARPQRNNVDYFPFYCEEGKKMFYLEETYGNDGFATFTKILRELAKSDYHYLNLSNPTTIMFLSAKCKVSKEVLEAIINDLVDLEKFDSILWNENKIIWCQDFTDSIQDAYAKRKNECITYNSLLHLLDSLGVRKLVKVRSKLNKSRSIAPVNPQTILKDTKLDNNKDGALTSFEHKKGKFIKWFNQMLKIHKGNEGRFRTLSPEAEKNYKKLIEAKHPIEDFNHVFKVMLREPWVVQKENANPSHFLRNDNFNRYLSKEYTDNHKPNMV